MVYRHTLSHQLFDLQHVAFCELIAWGFTQLEASQLTGGSSDRSNASKSARSKKNAPRISGLKAKPREKREWEYAYAALILNRWSALAAYKRLGQDLGYSDTNLRKRASRALQRPVVKFAIVNLSRYFELSKRLQTYVERNQEDAEKHYQVNNRVRLTLMGIVSPKRRLMHVAAVQPAKEEESVLRNAAGKRICGARTRSGNGAPCQMKPVPGKKRCRLHGGLSTGPKTAEGKARSSQNARRTKVELASAWGW